MIVSTDGRPTGKPTSQLTSQQMGKPMSQPTSQKVGRPMGQPMGPQSKGLYGQQDIVNLGYYDDISMRNSQDQYPQSRNQQAF